MRIAEVATVAVDSPVWHQDRVPDSRRYHRVVVVDLPIVPLEPVKPVKPVEQSRVRVADDLEYHILDCVTDRVDQVERPER